MIAVNNLFLKYTDAEDYTLKHISFSVSKGELILICGPTGCGKSSLLNCLNGTLHHESNTEIKGDVIINNKNIKDLSISDICAISASVFQNPYTQICTATPETEIAFGLENLGLKKEIIKERINEALIMTNLEHCRHQPNMTLSGGQMQRLSIACALALKPKILLLDEPVSQLDPLGTIDILNIIDKLKKSHSLTVIITEHRVEDTLPLADKIMLMNKGKILSFEKTSKTLSNLFNMEHLGLNLPSLPYLFQKLKRNERPLKPQEAPLLKTRDFKIINSPRIKKPICHINKITFGYDKKQPPLFKDFDLTIYNGDKIALMGTNGAGKSTLLQIMALNIKPWKGNIKWKTKTMPITGFVMQSPDLMLFTESVKEEIYFAPFHAGKSPDICKQITENVAKNMGLTPLLNQPPFALSKGQRLRTAIASILSKQPEILFLDEPTTGQDRLQIEKMMSSLENQFKAIIFCTHDIDTASAHSNRVILLNNGKIIADDTPRNIFFDNEKLLKASIVQTSLLQYAQRLRLKALTINEFLDNIDKEGFF